MPCSKVKPSLDEDAFICSGNVVHKRITPVEHKLRYNVFSLLIDCEKTEQVAKRSVFFSANRWNLLSIYDKDFGDGSSLGPAGFVRQLLSSSFTGVHFGKIYLLAYPRYLGYAFNPLAVYYCFDESAELKALIFEVQNTFGERVHYVSSCTQKNGRLCLSGTDKSMRVSPFNDDEGRYAFKAQLTCDDLLIGVLLFQSGAPTINTWFSGKLARLTTRNLLWNSLKFPFFTLKVIIGIHYEALKLWAKGLKLVSVGADYRQKKRQKTL